jgi:hypothetical protein
MVFQPTRVSRSTRGLDWTENPVDTCLSKRGLKGLQLTVWLRRTDSTEEWVLANTISVRETCGNYLGMLDTEEPMDGGAAADVVSVVGVGDDVEFVFLELGWSNGGGIYMYLVSRRVIKVY